MKHQRALGARSKVSVRSRSNWNLEMLVFVERGKLDNLEKNPRMLLVQGRLSRENIAFYVPIGCARFATYCGKMYRCHLFPYDGLLTCEITQ